ncbi:MAG: hypothetical protein R2731_17805 [Nocardioides sp.]
MDTRFEEADPLPGSERGRGLVRAHSRRSGHEWVGRRRRPRGDAEAATFDDEPDHGLRDPAVRAAWQVLLREEPPRPRESPTWAAAPEA